MKSIFNDSATDHQLVRLVHRGDQKAMLAIFDRYWPLVWNAANRVVDDVQQCELMTEQVFLEFWRNPGEVRTEPEFLRVRLFVRLKRLMSERRGGG